MIFGNKRKSKIQYSEEDDTFTYDGMSIHVEESESGGFRLVFDDRELTVSKDEFRMMYMYFGILFRKMSGM